MSESENKTENTAESNTVDTAPYMKKTGQDKPATESASNNMMIPAALILVSAIVIGVTFYKDGPQTLPTQEDTPAATTADVETATKTAELTTSSEQTLTEENTVQTEISETQEHNTVADAGQIPAVNEAATDSTEKLAIVAVKLTPPANSMPHARPVQANRMHTPDKHKQIQSREWARTQTDQHRMELLQQRRQAYEREMHDRRTQYEAAMKSRQERRAKVAEAKKAVFQRVQQDRLAAEQKIQLIHKQIAKLHEEIHQIMRESRNNTVPVQMHSM